VTALIEQQPKGWRYRVMEGKTLVASSIIYYDLEEACNELVKRFPGTLISRFTTYE
jgi:hypothetical protein